MCCFLSSHGAEPTSGAKVVRYSKRLVVRPQVVYARRICNECQIIRCETKEELGAVAMLFGKSCLVGLRDAPPKVRSSRFINNNCPCNVIEPNAVKEIPFKLNTSYLGIDFEHNGATLRVVVRFRQVFGRDGIVRSLHGVGNGTTSSNGRAHRINASFADIRRVSINSFFQLEDGPLLFVSRENSQGSLYLI